MSIILVDKPKGITSFDVCFKMRKIFNTKKIGHTGTLDPNATGLMMILVGSETKANQFLVSSTKEYIATVKLGIKTETDDIDGAIIEERKCEMPKKEDLISTLNSFLGKSKQIPPMTSAIKINGKKLYEYKREGKSVDIKPRDIEVFDIELIEINNDEFVFKTKVSSGTYIRTIVQDILKKLNIIGTLVELRRTKIDDFSVEDSNTIEDIEKGNYNKYSMYDVLSKYYYVYNVKNREDIINGKKLKLDLDYEYILCADGNQALAIYKKEDVYRCVRGLL